MVEQGESSVRELSAAFEKAAADAIAANKGIAPSWVQAQAGARGYEVQVDSAGKDTLRAAGEGVKSVDSLAGAYTRAGQAAQSAADSAVSALERQNAEQERLNEATEKAAELERKRMGVDKEGFTTGKDGGRLTMGGDLTSLTGIFNFLKSAGVQDDEKARSIAREFADSFGNVQYFGNAGQIKYGGEGSTISSALLKAAESVTFAQKNQAPAALATPALTPAPAPAPAPTYVTNITLPGVGTKTVRAQDADSQAIVNDLVRQLAQARSVAIR